MRVTLGQKGREERTTNDTWTEPLHALHAGWLAQDLQCEEMCNEGERDLARFMMSIEVRRVRFLIKAYYRTRLHKIGTYNVAILDSPHYIACLSEAELKYCKDVFNAEGRCGRGTVWCVWGCDLPTACCKRGCTGQAYSCKRSCSHAFEAGGQSERQHV